MIRYLHDSFPGWTQQDVTEDVGQLVQSVRHPRLMLDLPQPQEVGHQEAECGLVVPGQPLDQVRQRSCARVFWNLMNQFEKFLQRNQSWGGTHISLETGILSLFT